MLAFVFPDLDRSTYAALGAASVVAFVGTLVAVPAILVRMPADAFQPGREHVWFARRHPVVRALALGVKNLLAIALLLIGLALLVLPGQGVLTILLGLGLLDFPGKRRLELTIVRRPAVRRALNALRRRFGRPPLDLPEPAA